MNSNAKEEIGRVLTEVLLPFHEVSGTTLRSVWETSLDGDLEAIHLQFDIGFLNISVDSSDDTIDVSLSREMKPQTINVAHLRPWCKHIGKPFGWSWLGVNQQGYTDSVSLSFGSVTPQFCITAVASALEITQNFRIIARQPSNRKKTKRSNLRSFALSA